jgi:hypothetical protein
MVIRVLRNRLQGADADYPEDQQSDQKPDTLLQRKIVNEAGSQLILDFLYLPTHARGSLHGRSGEEVSLAGKPKPSLQGGIYGVFRNRLPMRGA